MDLPKCESCGNRFENEQEHRKVCGQPLPKQKIGNQAKSCECVICGEKFTRKQDYQMHFTTCRKRKTGSSNDFECPKCHKVYRTKLGIEKHTCQECVVCGKCFKDKTKLQQHMSVHSDEKPFECQECSKRYKTEGAMHNHIRTTHKNQPKYQCVCGKIVKSSFDFTEHHAICEVYKRYLEGKQIERMLKDDLGYRPFDEVDVTDVEWDQDLLKIDGTTEFLIEGHLSIPQIFMADIEDDEVLFSYDGNKPKHYTRNLGLIMHKTGMLLYTSNVKNFKQVPIVTKNNSSQPYCIHTFWKLVIQKSSDNRLELTFEFPFLNNGMNQQLLDTHRALQRKAKQKEQMYNSLDRTQRRLFDKKQKKKKQSKKKSVPVNHDTSMYKKTKKKEKVIQVRSPEEIEEAQLLQKQIEEAKTKDPQNAKWIVKFKKGVWDHKRRVRKKKH
jgi:hypothetical protein